MESKIQGLIERVASKHQEAFQQFKNNLDGNEGKLETPADFFQALENRVGSKQEDALAEFSQKMTQEINPPAVMQRLTNSITQGQQNAIQEFAERWESGQIAEDEPNPEKKKKKFIPKFMQNLITPQMFLQEIQFDSPFTFEKIAFGILQVTKQKDPNLGGDGQQSRKPRGGNLAQNFANAIANKQNRQPKKSRPNQTQTNIRLNDIQSGQLGKSLDLNAQFTEYRQSSTIQNKQQSKTPAARKRVESESKSNPQMFSPIQDKSFVIKMGKDSIRKHSLKKQKQAENQLMANIDFLRNMRGSPTESQKKQWKQQNSQIKRTIQDVKQSKRKQLEALGFTDSSKLLQSKLASSQTSSPQRADFLPEIRQSRKRGQIYKPTAFSVYTIQRDNEIFYNKIAK